MSKNHGSIDRTEKVHNMREDEVLMKGLVHRQVLLLSFVKNQVDGALFG